MLLLLYLCFCFTSNSHIALFAIIYQVPQLNWREVVRELDHKGFAINSKAGLRLVVQALLRGLAREPFPIDCLYKPWQNTEGQVSSLFVCKHAIIDVEKNPSSHRFVLISFTHVNLWGIRGAVVVCWTAGQQVERSILTRGMIHNKIHLISPG